MSLDSQIQGTVTQASTASITQLDLLEVAKLYCDRGDYDLALPKLMECARLSLIAKDFSTYLKSVQFTLRIYAEREEFDQLSALKERLQDLVIREGFELNARVYYVFGIAAMYKSQVETAQEYFKISLEQSLKTNNKEDICYAILGIVYCYRSFGRIEDALKEIYNLNIFLQYLDNPDLKSSVLTANAMVLMSAKKYEDALNVLWQAYENTKFTKQISVATGILCQIGACLFELGQVDFSRVYFDLARKSVDVKNAKRLLSDFAHYFERLENTNKVKDHDLAFDFENHVVSEKTLGRVDFKNQFILLDLLKLFISRQGEVFSKEFLVEHIWKQQYEPETHDNKIYVTIKRLRKMIEPDYDHPKYIFRSKNGYFLNKSIKVVENVSLTEDRG